MSIPSYRQRVGGDKLPSIKSWKVDVPLDTAAACGTGWERAGEEVGMWSGVSQGAGRPVATLPSISKPSDTVIYGSIIFYCCRYSRLESTSYRSRLLSIIAAISQVVKAINRGIRPILESHY